VLLACGAAVVAGTAFPAQASGGDGAEVLVGLALPERAVGPSATPRGTATGPRAYVVRVGDSLWSIARTHPAPGTDVDARWRAIWRHNRTVVGADPDLIHPGQSLRLPRASTSVDAPTHTEKDGDRR
jgi:nucleoid-associated protein YgaU